jgi:hypothetical protein
LHQLSVVFIVSIHEVEAIDRLQSQVKGCSLSLEVVHLLGCLFFGPLCFADPFFNQLVDIDLLVLSTIKAYSITFLLYNVGSSMHQDLHVLVFA